MPSTSSSLLPYPGHSSQLATFTPSGPRPSPPTKLLPLIEAAGEYGSRLVYKHFFLVELNQIKAVLVSMSLVIFCLLFSFVDYVPVKGEIIWYFSLTAWLISLSIMFSSSIHAVAKGISPFFLSAA